MIRSHDRTLRVWLFVILAAYALVLAGAWRP
jgi:hypothetical protein